VKNILSFYLYCENKQTDTLLYLDKKIADILKIMDEALIQKYVEGTAIEQEISIVRDYLTENDDMERCYDIILMMRKNAMKKLGIESDFLTNKENKENCYTFAVLKYMPFQV
jgi:hypothetical protein